MLITTKQPEAGSRSGFVDALSLVDVTLAEMARRCGGTLLGEDRPVLHLRPVGATPVPDAMTFAADGRSVRTFLDSHYESAIVRAADIGLVDTSRRSVIIHRDPAESFYALHVALLRDGRYGTLESERGRHVDVAPSAVVHAGARLGDAVRIDEGAVVYPNTIIGDGAVVAAGAVIGGDGFEVVTVDGRQVMVPHGGGVVFGDGVAVGSQTCVARGVFSTFTTIGSETMVDDLVAVAGDVSIGDRCALGATAGLSRGATLDDDALYGPGATCERSVHIGRGAVVETGSVVVGDVEPFTLVRGNPAGAAARVCLCRTELSVGDEWVVRCPSCGREYAAPGGILSPL